MYGIDFFQVRDYGGVGFTVRTTRRGLLEVKTQIDDRKRVESLCNEKLVHKKNNYRTLETNRRDRQVWVEGKARKTEKIRLPT